MAAAMSALPAAAPPTRPRVLLIATALVSAAAGMAIAATLGVYLYLRDQAGGTTHDFLPDGVTVPLAPSNIAMGTILLSAITMHWAVYSLSKGDRRDAQVALGLTTVLAAAFINAIAFQMGSLGAPLADSSYSVAVHVVLGLHLAVFVGAMLMLGVMAFRTLGGQYGPHDAEGLVAAAWFWYFAVIAFAPIWLIVLVNR